MKPDAKKRINLRTLTGLSVGAWVSPLVTVVSLPAHAATSAFSPNCIVGPWESNGAAGEGPNAPNIAPTLDFKVGGSIVEDNSEPTVGAWNSDGLNVTIANLQPSNSSFIFQLSGVLSDNCNTLIGTYTIESIGETANFRMDRL